MTTLTNFVDLKKAMTEQLEAAMADGRTMTIEEAEARAMEKFWLDNKPMHNIRQDVIDEWMTATHQLADALYWDEFFGHAERDGELVHLSALGKQGASHFFLNKLHWTLDAQRKFWEDKLAENGEIMKRHIDACDNTEIWLNKSESIAKFGDFCETQVTFWQQLADQMADVYQQVHDAPINPGRRGKHADAAKAAAATVAAMNAVLERRRRLSAA